MEGEKRISAQVHARAGQGLILEIGDTVIMLTNEEAQRLLDATQFALNRLWLADWQRPPRPEEPPTSQESTLHVVNET